MASMSERARDIIARYQMGTMSLQESWLEYMKLAAEVLARLDAYIPEPEPTPAEPPAQYKVGDRVAFQEHPDEYTTIELDGFVIRGAWNITHSQYEYTIESQSSPWQMPQFHIVPERDIMGLASQPGAS